MRAAAQSLAGWLCWLLQTALLALLLGLPAAQAADAAAAIPKPALALALDQVPAGTIIGTSLDILKDPDGRLTIDDVRAPGAAFVRSTQAVPNFSYTSAVFWFRLAVRNGSDAPLARLIENQYPLIDDLQWHVVRSGVVTAFDRGGRLLPFAERAVTHRNLIFPLALAPGEQAEVYLRVQSDDITQLPLAVWDAETFAVNSHHEQFWLGMYYGTLISALLFNLLLYLSIRDRSYLYYVLYLGCYIVFQLALNGLAYEYLWPGSPDWGRRCLPLFVYLTLLAVIQFNIAFLDLKRRAPRLYRVFSLLSWPLAAFATASLLLPYTAVIWACGAAAIAVTLLSLTAGALSWRNGYRQARYFLVAWTLLVIGVVMYALKAYALLPSNFATEYGLQIGSALEVLLLSFALAHRMRLLKEDNEHILTQAQQMLEARVAERTTELDLALHQLSHANQELQRLNTVDGLTGVHNRSHFDTYLESQLLMSKRSRRPLSLLMIDIDHFKHINDSYGHQAGDACLRAVAQAIAALLKRPEDCLARFGGEEFAVVLPHTEIAGAMVVGEKIRAAVADLAVAYSGHLLRLQVSIGASASEDFFPEAPAAVLARSDAALYDAKHGGRNRVCQRTAAADGIAR